MASNENNDQVNEAIKDLLRRGHPFRGKKMNAPQGEPGLPHRPRKEDAPPKYGKADEAGALPSYDTKEKPSVSEKRSTDEEPSGAEKAVAEEPVAPPKIRPILFIRPKKTGPTVAQVLEAKYQKMMGSLGNMVKTEKEVEQGAKLTEYDIAQRAEAHFIKENLKLRYFYECSEEHFNEFKKLVSDGMSVDEACAAHSGFRAWMAVETERERSLHIL